MSGFLDNYAEKNRPSRFWQVVRLIIGTGAVGAALWFGIPIVKDLLK